MSVSIAIINYNTRDLLVGCLQSIRRSFPSDTEIIVVDNASCDLSVSTVEKQFPQVQLVRNSGNLGFSKACNQAMRLAHGEVVLLSNPDIEFFDESYKHAINYLEKDETVGIVGPRLLNNDGTLQPSAFRNFPSLLTVLWENTLTGQVLNRFFPEKNLPGKYLYSNIEHESLLYPAHVSGALLVLRKETWVGVGGFDERFFMFREETDFCKRARDLEWEIIYLPDFRVYHHQAQSIKIHGLENKLRLYLHSTYLYHIKHFGTLSSAILCLLNLSKSAADLAVFSLVFAVSRILRIRAMHRRVRWYLIYSYLTLKIHLIPKFLLRRGITH